MDQIDVILLDFFKAFTESFNKVPQQHLLHKLQYYRVARKTLSLSQIESFMTGRIQQVAVQGTLSSSAAVLFGVPQGMVLCPLFYLVQSYIPVLDLLQLTTFCIDYRRIKDQHDQAQLEEDLDSLRDWEHTWQMEFNPSKCNIIHIMPNKQSLDIQLFPWANTGNKKCQQVPGHHHQQWPLLWLMLKM